MIPTECWVLPRPRADFYVGGFPRFFEKKLWRLLGEPEKVLHPFGGLCEIGDSVDLNETTAPTWGGDAHDLYWIDDETDLRTFKEAIGSKLIWKYRLQFFNTLESFIEAQNAKKNDAKFTPEELNLIAEMEDTFGPAFPSPIKKSA